MSPHRSTLPDYISKKRAKFKNRRRAFFSKGIAVLNAVKIIFGGWNFVVGFLGRKLPKSTFFRGHVWGAMSPPLLGLLLNFVAPVDYAAQAYWKLYRSTSQPSTTWQQVPWHFLLKIWHKLVQLWGAVSSNRGRNSKNPTTEFSSLWREIQRIWLGYACE